MVTGLFALLALVSGCEPPRSPVYGLRIEGFADPEPIWAGAAAWRALDFGLAPLDGEPELWVTVQHRDLGGAYGGLADRARAVVLLDGGRLAGWQLQATAAHELGHIMLDTGAHLGPGLGGVMASPPTATALSAADRELACDVAGRGCE